MGQSWSMIRKQLEEDLLCEKLRGRVQYFFTVYHKAPDRYGRFAIRVDGEEIYKANPYNERYYDEIAQEIKAAQDIPGREWKGKEFVHDEENRIAEDAAARKAVEDGHADSYDVTNSINEYLNQAVEKSLQSDNLLLRMFAVLDRRVGKRTLLKLKDTYGQLPDWLRQFYELRFSVEGIPVFYDNFNFRNGLRL